MEVRQGVWRQKSPSGVQGQSPCGNLKPPKTSDVQINEIKLEWCSLKVGKAIFRQRKWQFYRVTGSEGVRPNPLNPS